jgi:hypothetical protein
MNSFLGNSKTVLKWHEVTIYNELRPKSYNFEALTLKNVN